ncbi:RDD family protein [Flavobacterium sp. LC2016-12]|uniref:RDD family protein n=1 Tax=Flavobacterium sp. LC2016-12 TaxID=2783794 RepID=UPI00188AB53B|nr:RDD family protein [Flavobacterium sp. LC2016-12]MBF4464468.1 RDD family protein [Flavobacterium sp. LC2016-12]
MENNFTKVMSIKTEEELIKIVTVNRTKYQELAIDAAEKEIELRKIDTSTFETLTAKVETEDQIIKKIENNTVKSRIRFVNFTIDFVVVFILYFMIEPVLEAFLPLTSRAELSIFRIGFLIIFISLYYIPFEYKTQKTLGKIITKTKVVTLEGNKPELIDIVSRTFCRLIPFDRFSFFYSRNGFHDAISRTKVIKDNV